MPYTEGYKMLNNSHQIMTSNHFTFFTYKNFPLCDLKILILGLPVIIFNSANVISLLLIDNSSLRLSAK